MSQSLYTPESYLDVKEVIDKDALYFVKRSGSTASKGVNILRIPFGEEKKNYSDMKVFPSPFYIPSMLANMASANISRIGLKVFLTVGLAYSAR